MADSYNIITRKILNQGRGPWKLTGLVSLIGYTVLLWQKIFSEPVNKDSFFDIMFLIGLFFSLILTIITIVSLNQVTIYINFETKEIVRTKQIGKEVRLNFEKIDAIVTTEYNPSVDDENFAAVYVKSGSSFLIITTARGQKNKSNYIREFVKLIEIN